MIIKTQRNNNRNDKRRLFDNHCIFFGESITKGDTASGANATYPAVLSGLKGWTYENNGVNGQTIQQGTDTPIDTNNIPYKTIHHKYLFFQYNINDTWKPHGVTPSTVVNYQTDFTSAFNTSFTKGWAPCNVKVIVGLYVVHPVANNPLTGSPYFTAQDLQDYLVGIKATCTSLGIQCIDITGTTYGVKPDGVHLDTDADYITLATAISNQLT